MGIIRSIVDGSTLAAYFGRDLWHLSPKAVQILESDSLSEESMCFSVYLFFIWLSACKVHPTEAVCNIRMRLQSYDLKEHLSSS